MLELQDTSLKRLPIGNVCWAFIAASTILTVVTALGVLPPDWLQPTVVGILLSTLFLLGLAAGSVRQGSFLFACLALADCLICKSAMQVMTSLNQSECLLIVICCLGVGWITVHLDYSAIGNNAPRKSTRRPQWTMWDIGLLTAWVASLCHAFPRLDSPANLLIEVGFVIVGIAVTGWMAVRWVYDDRWTLIKLVAIVISVGFGIGLTCVMRPAQMSLLQLATWMLTGPMAVVAAHCLTVLAALTLVRIDSKSLFRELIKPTEETSPEPEQFKLRVYS